jgi:leader peptidase (prepilin peptidase)/N-methyltransferase
VTLPQLVVLAAIAGGACGTFLAGALEDYAAHGSLRPWPPSWSCPPALIPLLFLPLLGPLIVAALQGQRSSSVRNEDAPRLSSQGPSLEGSRSSGDPSPLTPFPLTLLLAQAAQGALWAAFAARYGFSPLLPITALEGSLLLAVLFVDARHRLVPYALVVPGALLAFATSPLWPGLGFASSALGGVGAFVVFSVLVRLAHQIFGEGAFGQGDANLAGWIGLLCGYPLVVVALSVGVFLGGIGAVALLVLRHGALRATMPYGPYLVAGILYVLLRGNTVFSPFTYV